MQLYILYIRVLLDYWSVKRAEQTEFNVFFPSALSFV